MNTAHISRILKGEVAREALTTMRNASKSRTSKRLEDSQSHAKRRKQAGFGRARNLPENELSATDAPSAEPGNDGRIRTALDGLLSRSLARDETTGRFTHGKVTTGAESRGLFEDLAPVKADIVASVRLQLAADTDDAPPTLLHSIDAYADAYLLRKATFMQLAQRGGPVTNKGKVRGLLQAWCSFLDRELRLVQMLGLERKQRDATLSAAEWLMSQRQPAVNEPATDDGGSVTTTDAEHGS